MDSKLPVWVVRAGEEGGHADAFVNGGLVGLAWKEAGPIDPALPDAEIEARFAKAFPEAKEGARRVWAAQVKRFLREFKVGDPVSTSLPERRLFLLGTIAGEPEWRNEPVCHVRKVNWTHQVPRDVLSTATRNSLGSIATVFRPSWEVSQELFAKAVPFDREALTSEPEASAEAKVPPSVFRRDPEHARRLVEQWLPDPTVRLAALALLGRAIDQAHQASPDCWSLPLRKRPSMTLTVGCSHVLVFRPSGLVAAVSDSGPGGTTADASAPHEVELSTAQVLSPTSEIENGLFDSIRRLAPTPTRETDRRRYSEGAMIYLERQLGRAMPRPAHAEPAKKDDAKPCPPTAVAVVTPTVQFTERRYTLDTLLKYLEMGDIALPDMQRPFVWKKTKVRDLFDSMYRGYPVGSLMLWATADQKDVRVIGTDKKQRVASLLVVDGQQRLTSLYAVLRGQPVLDDTFKEQRIEIAFRPRDGAFDVTDAAKQKDPEYISNISELWMSGKPSRRLVNDFVEQLRAKREVTETDEDAISHNLDRLFDLTQYPFTTLEIAKDVDEEAVAEIFVRINSGGSKLGQSEFILTLLSVHSPETRRALEDFARLAWEQPTAGKPSPFNHVVQPQADDLLKAAIAVGFRRARLSAVYQLLRGKDPATGVVSAEVRDRHFRTLAEATKAVLDITSWHRFLTHVIGAGFRSSSLVSSANAVLYSYALYLIGKHDYAVEDKVLGRLIAKWFFAASVSGRYSGSSESVMEEDLSLLRQARDAGDFVRMLEEQLSSVLTHDFWDIRLPRALETSSGNSPVARTYVAAQVKLGAPVLFSDRRVGDLYDPTIVTPRKSVEDHHLFPRAYLRRLGLSDNRQINQAGNLALLEWPDNVEIGDSAPSEYVPEIQKQFSGAAWQRMCNLHALPAGWEQLPYEEFLRQRRHLMARTIRDAFHALAGVESSEGEPQVFGTAEEKSVWILIEQVELELRKLIRRKYDAKYANAADDRIRKQLTEQEVSALEINRSKHLASYRMSGPRAPADLLDYFYLMQLLKFITTNEMWAEFRAQFERKEVLQDLASKIVAVRNDRAHFRRVPDKELQRCAIACDDLLLLIRKDPPPVDGAAAST